MERLGAEASSPTTGSTELVEIAPVAPAYSSLLGANNTIYLNFCGDTVATFLTYHNITSPVFDTDGNPSSFSQGELDAIYNIWKGVSEAFAPFKVNVTTVAPPSMYTGKLTKINIGGDGAWLGKVWGGYAEIGTNPTSTVIKPAIGFVFPKNLNNGDPKEVAEAAAHEAGHTFGLEHHSAYTNGVKTNEYYTGPGDDTGPFMGTPYADKMARWWYGVSTSPTTYQNDFQILTNVAGLKTDAHPNTMAMADPLTVSNGQVSGAGIIETMGDVDYFSFLSGAGAVNLAVNVGTYHMLSAEVKVFDVAGKLLATGLPDSNGNSAIQTTLPTDGIYYLAVSSSGMSPKSTPTNYGFNVGSYTITGTIQPSSQQPIQLMAPVVKGTISGGIATLTWHAIPGATHYKVYRTTDHTNWLLIAIEGPNTLSQLNSGLKLGTTYYYRVDAIGQISIASSSLVPLTA